MDAINAKVTINLSSIEDDRATLDGKVLFDHNNQPEELELDLTGATVTTLNKLLGGAGKPALQRPPVHVTLNHYKQCCPKVNLRTENEYERGDCS